MPAKLFKPKCLATAIGSLPFAESKSAYELVLKYLPEIPVSPEFPMMGYKHTFCGPFLENLPGLVADDKREIFYFNTSIDNSGEFEKFYENYLSGNLDYFKISYERGIGFYNLLKMLQTTRPSNIQYFKTQMPGPITTGLTIKDETDKNIIYNEEFMQIIIKAIVMKAKWQINEIKKTFPDIIFFFDEPGLVNYGSSYFNIEKNYIIQCLNEVFEAVNVTTGSHCCGNTDWSILMESKVNIISFDAYTYSGAMVMYPDHLKKFLSRNGCLAWGIIPNSQKIFNHTPEALAEKLENEINILVQKGFSKKDILNASLITPACGLGSATQDIAQKVLWTLQRVSMILRTKYSLNNDLI
ncbi:hypothetical protein HY745_07720 [Candidatus Desantisbacteria bacterium]|nr:hypothetical protein [Candidatus Desantisbacteria bacterium]